MEYHCNKCDRHLSKCICDLSIYADIGDVSACQFLDDHVKYGPGSGSPFFQGWSYKHKQMLYKNEELRKLVRELVENMEEYEKYGELAGIDSDLIQRTKRILNEV